MMKSIEGFDCYRTCDALAFVIEQYCKSKNVIVNTLSVTCDGGNFSAVVVFIKEEVK